MHAIGTRVGLIGLGTMGGAMANRLVEAGCFVLGYDVSPESGRAFEAAGGRLSGRVEDLAGCTDVVIMSVPGPRETEAILLGPDGLLSQMREGMAVISTSTVSPELMVRVARAGSDKGIDVLDAPVTGAADGARSGTLTFMVGADIGALERWRSVLEPLSSVVVHTGPPGTGSAAKLLTNLLWFTHLIALCDSMAAAAKCGISPATMSELLPVSAGASWVAEHDLPNLLGGDDDDSFTLALCCKDLGLIRNLSEAADAPLTLVDSVYDRFQAAARQFGSSAGELAVSRLAEAAAGVSIRTDNGFPRRQTAPPEGREG